MAPPADATLAILIPIHNDWDALGMLLDELAVVLPQPATVILVDDGSTVEPQPTEIDGESVNPLRPRGQLERVQRVRLRRNVGHQRAIAIGLVYVYENFGEANCVVMDGDGEDNPVDIRQLLEESHKDGGKAIVFGARTRRSERWWFQIGYHAYRLLHRVLTGLPVRVGNFSLVPSPCLARLVVISEMWNHYAAAVIKSRIPYRSIPSARRKRLSGQSSMNLVSLITHGLSAISVYGETVGVRVLMATSSLAGLVLAAQAVVLLRDLERLRVAPEQALQSFTFLVLGMLITLVIVALFVFVILSGRQNPVFLPLRDAHFFVLDAEDQSSEIPPS